VAGAENGVRHRGDRGARLALYAFAALVAVALPLWLYLGRHRWFTYDEWAFLAGRTAGSLDDLLEPHAGAHWSTLPVLWYRAMWNLVGIRTYVPYQLLLVVLHLVSAVLIRVVMRRAGVHPWIATAAAALFVLLGAGSFNIVWAFQVNEVGSLVFGLTFLLLIDHDGPWNRRDWLGLLAGLAGLMCSGLGVTMVVVVGFAALLKRGWRTAFALTAPLAALFLVWLTSSAWDEYSESDRPTLDVLGRFVSTGITHGFDSMGQLPGVGVVLALVLVVGLWLAWSPLRGAELRQHMAAPLALLLGALMLLVSAGLQRGVQGSAHARSSYYTHLFIAMVLPATALAADALVRRWRVLTLPLCALFLVGIPGNLEAVDDDVRNREEWHGPYRSHLLTSAYLPEADELPPTLIPEPLFAQWVSLGWLLDGVDSGRVPKPDSVDPAAQANTLLRLALTRSTTAPPDGCAPIDGPLDVALAEGDVITVNAGAWITTTTPEGIVSEPLVFGETQPDSPVVVAFPLTVKIAALDAGRPPALCR
jgi:hypothetical protein